jgi:hypothetical protein
VGGNPILVKLGVHERDIVFQRQLPHVLDRG